METLNLFELRQTAYQPCRHQSQDGQANFATCSACAAEAKGHGGDRAKWRRARATAELDAAFPPRYADAAATEPAVIEWVDSFIAAPRDVDSLLLVGVTGVGKTFQAYGALRAVATLRPITWKSVTFSDFTASLRPSAKDPDTALKSLRDVDLLLLDDLGTAKHTEWVEEITYRLINHRYEAMKASIFTTNVPLPELRDAVGDRIASRLVETTTIVPLIGDDRRRRNVAKRTEKES